MATKKLGSISPLALTETVLYTVPTGKSAVAVLSICNTNTTTDTVRIAISTSITLTMADYIEYDVQIPANGVLERTSIAMGENENLIVRASSSNVSFRLYGIEE